MSNYRKKVLEARKQILQLTLDQEKQIIEIYSKQASKLIDEILEMPESRTRTHKIDTTRIINEYVKELYENLNDNILKNTWESSYIQRKVILNFVDTVAPNRVVNEGLKRSITNISDNTVRTLIAGGYYSDGKTLSNRLWNYTKQNGQDIDTIIKMNVAGGANVRTLASELEKYVNPKNRIESKSFKAGLNSYKISFNAQRLARTSITHAATETQIQNAKKNPFSLGLKWNLSASHSARMHGRQDECDSREGKVYEPDKVPLQHPNCLCYFTEEVDEKKALTDIKAWASGDLENKQMDEWFNDFKEKWNGPTNIENKEPIKVKVNDVKISIPDKKKESKVSTWHEYKADDKQYSSKKAIKEHLSKEYKM
ncbi:hypothetical protein [Clostridium sp. YIM B02555]|uniref:hypothetical protein n=1 Tax=Clostridium sp. YIM B02555 TaxID=2911968 RepID=UPI001EEDACA6|nr:hypothetical protein [Clostridium sp. YIM B02555]